jgi:hypothetical protein
MTKISIIKELQKQFDNFDTKYKEIIEKGLKIADDQK